MIIIFSYIIMTNNIRLYKTFYAPVWAHPESDLFMNSICGNSEANSQID